MRGLNWNLKKADIKGKMMYRVACLCMVFIFLTWNTASAQDTEDSKLSGIVSDTLEKTKTVTEDTMSTAKDVAKKTFSTVKKATKKTLSTAKKATEKTVLKAKELSGMSIVGNDEAPKSLYIVPWKSSELGVETSMNMMLNEADVPVDKEVFKREVNFYNISTKQ